MRYSRIISKPNLSIFYLHKLDQLRLPRKNLFIRPDVQQLLEPAKLRNADPRYNITILGKGLEPSLLALVISVYAYDIVHAGDSLFPALDEVAAEATFHLL